MDLAVTVPAVLPSQFDHIRRQALLVRVILKRFTLRRAMLPKHRTGTPLGDAENMANLINAASKVCDVGSRKTPTRDLEKTNACHDRGKRLD